MLNRIGNAPLQMCPAPMPAHPPENYNRNELEDVKKAIEYLYEFKEKLSKLNPMVLDVIENILQRPRY